MANGNQIGSEEPEEPRTRKPMTVQTPCPDTHLALRVTIHDELLHGHTNTHTQPNGKHGSHPHRHPANTSKGR